MVRSSTTIVTCCTPCMPFGTKTLCHEPSTLAGNPDATAFRTGGFCGRRSTEAGGGCHQKVEGWAANGPKHPCRKRPTKQLGFSRGELVLQQAKHLLDYLDLRS